mgnify:FL=1
MQQAQTTPNIALWHTNSADVPFTFSADFSVRPTPPALSVGPHFTPKKRGRPPKTSPFLDLDFAGETSNGSAPVKKSCLNNNTITTTTTTSTTSYDADRKDGVFSSLQGNSASSNDGPSEDAKTDDVFIGAYLLSQLCNRSVPTCVNCQTRRTPLWRKGWRDAILKRDVLLCNACGLKYSKRQYCCYCKFIYNMKEDVLSQQGNWMDCDCCRRWVHIDCELRFGSTFTFDGRKYHGPAKYFCPDCQQDQKQQQLQAQNQLLTKPPQPLHQLSQQQQQTQPTNLPPSFAPGQAITLPLPVTLSPQQRPQLAPLPQHFAPPRLTLPSLIFPSPATTPTTIPALPSFDKLNSAPPPSAHGYFNSAAPPFPFNPSAGGIKGNFPATAINNSAEPMTF